MSQQEFEKNDQEVIDLVNRSAAPDAKIRAEKIADAVRESAPDAGTDTEKEYQEAVMKVEEIKRGYRREKKARTILAVAACIAITAILMVALFVPSIVVWVVNIGVLFCGMAAAIAVDRYIRGC